MVAAQNSVMSSVYVLRAKLLDSDDQSTFQQNMRASEWWERDWCCLCVSVGNVILEVYEASVSPKARNIFTKPQRKTISQWKDQAVVSGEGGCMKDQAVISIDLG